MEKACNRCGVVTPATDEYFGRRKDTKGGLNAICKKCKAAENSAYRKATREARNKQKQEWRKNNPDKVKEMSKKYAENNPEKLREKRIRYYYRNREVEADRSRKYRSENTDIVNRRKRDWEERNKERVNENRKLRLYERLKDPDYEKKYCLNHSMANRMNASLNGNKNGRAWEKIVGYTLSDLIAHLESRFTEGMSWENRGRGGWHIDHIKPIASFNFKSADDPEFLECWALDNLQPLWELDNLRKKDRIL